MKKIKKIIAMIVAVGLIAGTMPAQSLLVQAEDTRTLTYASGATQDSNNRYLIYLNVEGTTASDTLPGSSSAYWSNNTVYIDGKAVSGDGVNYSITSSTANNVRQVYLCLKYVRVEETATKASNIGTHLLYIPAGTVIGGITTANDISVKLNGTSVSQAYGVNLTRSGGGNQPGSSRYQVVFNLNGVTAFPDAESVYWNQSKVLIDGVETAVPFGYRNSNYSETTPLSFAAYVSYNTLLSGATTASGAGKHLMEIPAGTFFGKLAVLETVRVLLVNGNILDVSEQELTCAGGGGQDNNSRYLIYLGNCVAPATSSFADNDVYIDGELVEELDVFSLADGSWGLILPYAKIPNGGSTSGTMGSHEMVIPKGSLVGNYITTNDLTITIDNYTIVKKNTLTLELQKVVAHESNKRYQLTFSLGDATADLASGSYWNNQTLYVDGSTKTEGVHWAPSTSSNTLVLYLDYNAVQEGASSYSHVTDTHIVKVPKGTMIGDIYIEKDMILQISGATVTQLEKDPTEREVLNVGTTNDWRNSQENMSGIYFKTTVADPLTAKSDWTARYPMDSGAIYYNDTPLSNAKVIKILDSLYYITVEGCGITWTPGDTIVLDGVVKSGYTDVTFNKIGFIRNRDGSFSQYDAQANRPSKNVMLEDLYVDMEAESYIVPSTPLITNGYVSVSVDDKVTTEYALTEFGEHQVKRTVDDTTHMEAVSGLTTITYQQTVILYKLGDANGDGAERSVKDLVSMLKQAESSKTDNYSKMAIHGADMNYDNVVTKEDAAIMRECLVGKRTLDDVRETYDDKVVFGVISDMHYAEDNSDAQRRINTKKALQYYKSQNVDLIYMNGDISDYGGTTSYANLVKDIKEIYPDEDNRPILFMSADNHEYFDAWSHGSFVPTATFPTVQERFVNSLADVRGDEVGTNTYCKINGYHFISISSDGMNGAYATYSDETKNYLQTYLEKAAMEDPKKPIFVGIHQPPKNTVIGSDKEYSTELTSILEQYPQAIVFTSHTHCTIMDERSIWQGEYTVVNTAALYYMSGYSGTEIGQRYAQGLLVTVDNNSVDIKRYDFWNEEQIKENWVITNPSDKTSFTYTDSRATQRVAPEFANNASVTATWLDDETVSISFPAAEHNDFVYSYKVGIYQNGALLRTETFSSYYFLGLNKMPDTVTQVISNLNALANYEFKVTALESWGKESTVPISGTLSAK